MNPKTALRFLHLCSVAISSEVLGLTVTVVRTNIQEKEWRVACHCVIMFGGGDNMIRTQVSLDEREYQQAKREAKALSISVAEYVRRAVRRSLPLSARPPWMRYAGLVESGNPKSSQLVDDVVYGHKD